MFLQRAEDEVWDRPLEAFNRADDVFDLKIVSIPLLNVDFEP